MIRVVLIIIFADWDLLFIFVAVLFVCFSRLKVAFDNCCGLRILLVICFGYFTKFVACFTIV